MLEKRTGRILRSLSGFYDVQTPAGLVTCRGRGILRREGYEPTTKDFLRIGVPFTLTAVIAGYLLIWVIWS